MKTEYDSKEEDESKSRNGGENNLTLESGVYTNFLTFPVEDVKRRSIVSFNLDDDHISEKISERRLSLPSTRSSSRRPSVFSTINTQEFDQTIGRLGGLVIVLFLFIVMMVVYNWWDNIRGILNPYKN